MLYVLTVQINPRIDLKGYLVTIDIEKAFDLLDHNFLISILEKSGFGQTFIDWIKIFA